MKFSLLWFSLPLKLLRTHHEDDVQSHQKRKPRFGLAPLFWKHRKFPSSSVFGLQKISSHKNFFQISALLFQDIFSSFFISSCPLLFVYFDPGFGLQGPSKLRISRLYAPSRVSFTCFGPPLIAPRFIVIDSIHKRPGLSIRGCCWVLHQSAPERPLTWGNSPPID